MPPSGEFAERYAVHLTTDDRPEGHGLPDGREVTSAQSALLGYQAEDDGKRVSLDHTMFRLRLRIQPGDRLLISFLDMPGMTDSFALGADISGYLVIPPDDPALQEAAERSIEALLRQHPSRRKSPSWYLYRGDIPVQWVVSVAYRTESGSYHEGPLSEFLEATQGEDA